MGRFHTALALVCAAALGVCTHAAAAVTIGQVSPSAAPPTTCNSTARDLLQPSVTSGNLYVAKQAGTITSWSTKAALGGNQEYTLKVYRRTTDPDMFKVIAHSTTHTLTSSGGLNTFATNIPVSSGDLLGFNAKSAANACTFSVPGDSVLVRTGNLADLATGTFTPASDSRLNLSAVLVPINTFSFGELTRNLHHGSATLEIVLPGPGSVKVSGKGLKVKKATKTIAVAGALNFGFAATGKRKKKLNRTGSGSFRLNATFTPTGGDPGTQQLGVKLKRKR